MIDCAALSKVFTRMSDSHESSPPRAKPFQTAANWPNCPPPPSFANKSFGDNIDCFAMSAALHVVFEPLHGCDCRPRNSAQGEDAGRAGVVTPRRCSAFHQKQLAETGVPKKQPCVLWRRVSPPKYRIATVRLSSPACGEIREKRRLNGTC